MRGLLRGLARRFGRSRAGAPAALTDYGPAIAASARLDCAAGAKLGETVERTEASALAIMAQVRALCDGSTALTARLRAASDDAGVFEAEVEHNVGALDRMATFLSCLPERLERDLTSIRRIATEIRGLGDLADSVQAISIQSHMLSINAAVEASRAGAQGLAFKVVAEEMRGLAANSHGAAARIGASLATIQGILKEGLEQNAERSADDLMRIAETAHAVARLQGSFDRVSGSYQAGFTDMLAHGEALAAGSADVLGQLQYQDVVRQCVERLRAAVERRNAVLADGFGTAALAPPSAAEVAALIDAVVDDYLAAEALHASPPDGGAVSAIELF